MFLGALAEFRKGTISFVTSNRPSVLPSAPMATTGQIFMKIDNWVSMFHRAFFNSIIDEHQHMHFFIQHYISLEC